MHLTKALLAVLSFGAVALALPADAAPAEAATPAAPADYCDKYEGRERRDCQSDANYCNKFDGRERRDCQSQRAPPRNDYCNKYEGRERRECQSDPNYCNKFDGRERRDCQSQRGNVGNNNGPGWNPGFNPGNPGFNPGNPGWNDRRCEDFRRNEPLSEYVSPKSEVRVARLIIPGVASASARTAAASAPSGAGRQAAGRVRERVPTLKRGDIVPETLMYI
ncbi:hypothetical protein EJ06DRAFT_300916 [Trichodelitschia bisporula]|uniref:Uncharacterized protein n=1 Tax=Trichodelitschia bisporula TaxID=703511 RepID=A0A6G1I7E8_9PEZI|nr:hypothetical protein EJ06DRAFT_300916 [Trichodelitschia bisporula]